MVDERASAGTNYYRLRQVDLDGSFEYSAVVAVDLAVAASAIVLSPNPASKSVVVSGLSDAGDQTVTVFNAVGQQLWQRGLRENVLDIDDLTAGVYYLSFSGEGAGGVKLVVQ